MRLCIIKNMIFDLLSIADSLGEDEEAFVRFCEKYVRRGFLLPSYETRLTHIHEMFIGKETKNG